jgi:Family of unknown function (DUF6101)
MIASTNAGHMKKPGSLLQGRQMSDEARPRAGSEGASQSAPAGQTPKRVRETRREAGQKASQEIGQGFGQAFAGATGELVVTRPIAGSRITSREKRSAFQGVMLKVPALGVRQGYAIVLAAVFGSEDVVLADGLDEDEIVARWRGLAASLGLPAMLCHANGETEFLHRQLGAVTLGRVSVKRRRRVATNRRPRFLMRRKGGRVATAKG